MTKGHLAVTLFITVNSQPFEGTGKLHRRNIVNKTTLTETNPSFDQLAAMEPELITLLSRAKAHRGNCANAAWYGPEGLRRAMSKVIGWERRQGPSELQGMAAYTTAYRTLYGALRNCRNCNCL
jgi:hypothetical protein